MKSPATVTSKELAKICGISLGAVQRYTDAGLIRPTTQRPRTFTLANVIRARAMRELHHRGFPIHFARPKLKQLTSAGVYDLADAGPVFAIVPAWRQYRKPAVIALDKAAAIDRMAAAEAPAHLVDVGAIIMRIRQKFSRVISK